MNLKGNTVPITGGASGIGFEMAQQLVNRVAPELILGILSKPVERMLRKS